ncbi:hypothetical protein PHSY_005443 [Pseudozyma hubeiensis SY62]|uniref:Large ribosomal subunit protein bL21m n=1 Tax=Pseudozyma hubeiensis (strain SY62) TaxID=1305764 RepID=R9PIF6_PSEHS|nr:hypothetical protein PHSY_005443 [Pseudozyma hubeiensis SY62]GAC97855.1 hypothetical protein PHSY_005443 [Pseudozyma hubeiensis SY62]
MISLRTSLSSAASSTFKGKAKQVTAPVVSFITHSRSISSSIPSGSTATTSSEPSTSTLPPSPIPIDSNSQALSLLKSQPSHYAIASITGRTYLVSKGDLVTVPRLKDVQVGDVLLLDKVHEIGSRDYTLRAQDTLNTRRISTSVDLPPSSPTTVTTGPSPSILPQPRRLFTRLSSSPLIPLSNTWSSRLIPNGLAHIGASLPPSTVKITAVVTENTKGALEKILKKKRRKGYKKTVQHKQPYTRIRIEDIQIQPST